MKKRVFVENNEFKEVIIQLLNEAIKMLYHYDYHIIYSRVSERCVCARLAFHLESLMRQKYRTLFEGYYVDVEYDRMGKPKKQNGCSNRYADPKRIGTLEKRHVCDLLIHRRGFYNGSRDNLLALEMKVHQNYSNVESDYQRLHNLVQHTSENNNGLVCETMLGVFLRIQEKQYSLTLFDIDKNNGAPNKGIPVIVCPFD